jgi:hypothetical protein
MQSFEPSRLLIRSDYRVCQQIKRFPERSAPYASRSVPHGSKVPSTLVVLTRHFGPVRTRAVVSSLGSRNQKTASYAEPSFFCLEAAAYLHNALVRGGRRCPKQTPILSIRAINGRSTSAGAKYGYAESPCCSAARPSRSSRSSWNRGPNDGTGVPGRHRRRGYNARFSHLRGPQGIWPGSSHAEDDHRP